MAEGNRIAVFVAGGTGGHMYPGIAAARALVKLNPPWHVVFAVRKGDMGKELLAREGFQVEEIAGQGLPRRLSLNMLTFPFRTGAGFLQAGAMLARVNPQVVIGMGGYLSFPVLLAARLKKIATLVHEQNVYPGLANRTVSRWANSVAVSFPESQKAFPAAKVWVSGLPVRPEIGQVSAAEGRKRFKLAEGKLTVLIFGGSLGAHQLNAAAIGAWPMLSDRTQEFQVLHVTGEKEYPVLQAQYQKLAVQAAVMPYCHDMAAALGAADWVISRAGASTVAELIVAGKPALLVPFPFASENHQFYNAETLVNRGAAELIPDTDFTPAKLTERLRTLLRDPQRLPEMRSRMEALAAESGHTAAAQRLADFITTL